MIVMSSYRRLYTTEWWAELNDGLRYLYSEKSKQLHKKTSSLIREECKNDGVKYDTGINGC